MNLTQWALAYFTEANYHLGGSAPSISEEDIMITETILTGTQEYNNGTRDFKNFEWLHEPETTMKAQLMRRRGEKLEFPDEKTLVV